ncbi:MAG: class I SAM-dependent methyltransferase [Deltaproteobacteria bacterium]|nr:class I SAM-dependent methyltransferase [Deltaproteobacteria bacterium]
MKRCWPEYLKDESLFSSAIRLRYLIWTIKRHVPQGSRLLEVGFGSGTTAVLLADSGYTVTAIDIDYVLVERFRDRYADWIRTGRLEAIQANMLALPWRKREFDLTYHQGVLEHFPDEHIVQALREQGRVAEWVIFDVPNHRYGDRPFGDERLLSPSYWRGLINQAGLEVVDERGRDFHRWLYLLPFAFFSHRALEKWPWFGRRFGISSIFVCRSGHE